VEQLVLVIDHSEDAFADSSENFGWTKAIGPMNIATIFYQLLKGGDADFKELIEVRTYDSQEFESFEKGLGGVLGLF
jgi:hypothetical protein